MLNKSKYLSPPAARGKCRMLVVMLAVLTLTLVGCNGDTIVAPEAAQTDALAATASKNAAASTSTSSVYTFPGGPDQMLIEGASASVVRTKNGINYRVATNSLTAGHAYTLWVVIFNEPASCATAPGTCTPPDLFNAAAEPDMLYGTGLIATGSGTAMFAGRTKVGDVSGTVQAPAGLLSYGLLDPFGAEIHFVVHHHGPKIPAFMPDMISTLAGGCTDAGIPGQGMSSPWNDYASSVNYAGEFGELGPNACRSVQYAIMTP